MAYNYLRVTERCSYTGAVTWYNWLCSLGHECWIEKATHLHTNGLNWRVWRKGQGATAADNEELCEGKIVLRSRGKRV